ncbi:MAG: RNA polymerase sigma factor [Candidatus Poribacteria bacterium]
MKQSITDLSNDKLESEIRRNPNNSCLWNELFTRLEPQLFPRALRTCNGNLHDAEDIVQEVFLAMVEKLSEIKSLTGYAHGIMRNKCSQWIKENQKMEERTVPPRPEGDDEPITDIQSDQSTPLERLVHDEDVDETFGLIEEFFGRKPKQWEIIGLKFFDKLPHKEIAAQLGISVGMSKKNLHKAVTALRKFCDKHNITSERLKHAVGRYYDEMPEQE